MDSHHLGDPQFNFGSANRTKKPVNFLPFSRAGDLDADVRVLETDWSEPSRGSQVELGASFDFMMYGEENRLVGLWS